MEEMMKVDIEKVVAFSRDSIFETIEPGDTNRSGFRKASNFRLQSCVVSGVTVSNTRVGGAVVG